MSNRFRKGILIVAGIAFQIVGWFPSDALSLVKRVGGAAADSPVRTLFIAVGIVLIIIAFWDSILDLLGIQTTKRLGANIKTWLLDSHEHPLLEAKVEKNSFRIVTRHDNRVFTISKDAKKPILFIGTTGESSEADKALYMSSPPDDRTAFKESIIFELARLDLDSMQVSDNNGILKVLTTYHIILDKEFDEFRLLRGIFAVNRAQTLVERLWLKWKREHSR